MGLESAAESSTVSDVDRGIIRCLTEDVRLPFAALGSILSMSEQTAKRRYEAMVRAGVLRVVAMQNTQAMGLARWQLRMRPRPGESRRLADLIARHPDISWVAEVSGGSEVSAVYRPPSAAARDDLLSDRLPRTSLIADITMQAILLRFPSGRGFPGASAVLSADQEQALAAAADPVHAMVDLTESAWPSDAAPLGELDTAIIAELSGDGRTPFARVGRAVGVAPARVSQRVAAMVRAGQLHFDIDVSVAALGFHRIAHVYLGCAPSALDRVGRVLVRADEVPFVGMTTGRTNLMCTALFRDDHHMYEFVTTTLGALDGITSVELVPVSRHVKSAGSFAVGTHLSAVPGVGRAR